MKKFKVYIFEMITNVPTDSGWPDSIQIGDYYDKQKTAFKYLEKVFKQEAKVTSIIEVPIIDEESVYVKENGYKKHYIGYEENGELHEFFLRQITLKIIEEEKV